MKSKIKYNKRMSWAIAGEILFGVLAIVGFFALGFTTKGLGHLNAQATGQKAIDGGIATINGTLDAMSAKLGFGKTWTLDNLHHGFGGAHPGWEGTAYRLGLAGIIIAFIAVIVPLCSAFIYNKKVDRYLSFSALLLDLVCLALLIASGSTVLYNLTTSHNGDLTAIVDGISKTIKTNNLDLGYKQLTGKDLTFALPKLMYKPGRAAGVYVLVFVGWAFGWAGNAYSYWHDYTFGKFAK